MPRGGGGVEEISTMASMTAVGPARLSRCRARRLAGMARGSARSPWIAVMLGPRRRAWARETTTGSAPTYTTRQSGWIA